MGQWLGGSDPEKAKEPEAEGTRHKWANPHWLESGGQEEGNKKAKLGGGEASSSAKDFTQSASRRSETANTYPSYPREQYYEGAGDTQHAN